jgi:hypothetical protein
LSALRRAGHGRLGEVATAWAVVVVLGAAAAAACNPRGGRAGGGPGSGVGTAAGAGPGQPAASPPFEGLDLGLRLVEPDPSPPPELPHVPGRAAGFYDGPGDVDLVRVAAARLLPIAPVTVEVSPVAGTRPRLRVLDPDGGELTAVTAQRLGDGVAIPNLGVPDGIRELWLEVSEVDGRTASFPYTLSVHRPEQPAQGRLEVEPNDTPETAEALEPGTIVAGFLHRADDVDDFHIDLSQPGVLSVIATPDTDSDIALHVAPAGATPMDLDLAGPGQPEGLCAFGVAAGAQLIGVALSSSRGSALPRYTLAARLETEPVEREPNDAVPTDALEPLVDGLRGYLSDAGDVDSFRLRLMAALDAPSDQVIRVEPPSGLDVAVEVTDEQGRGVVPLTDRAGPGQAEEVRVPRVTAVFRVSVRVGRRGGAGCGESYVVRVP